MFVKGLRGITPAIGVLSWGIVFAACATTRPTPPSQPPASPVLAPQVFKIPGEPVVLTPEEKALGNFLKGQVALDQGDYDTALTELEQAVTNDPNTPFLH